MGYCDYDKLSNEKLGELKKKTEERYLEIQNEISSLCNELLEIEEIYKEADKEIMKRQTPVK